MSFQVDNRTPALKVRYFVSAYSEKHPVVINFPLDSLYTDQSFKEEADINTIMARYQSTGEMPVLNGVQGQWLDVTEMDFQTHMDFILDAQQLFDQLPSAIRDRFGNDPGAFLGFTSDPENRLEMARMGLLTPEAAADLLRPPALDFPASDEA
ncbi:scaffolding protein [compost metagenome]